jgi:hypothetical protein
MTSVSYSVNDGVGYSDVNNECTYSVVAQLTCEEGHGPVEPRPALFSLLIHCPSRKTWRAHSIDADSDSLSDCDGVQ